MMAMRYRTIADDQPRLVLRVDLAGAIRSRTPVIPWKIASG